MFRFSVKEKIFLSLFFVTLLLVISEYMYMNNHSVSGQRIQRINALLRAGFSLDEIRSSEPKQEDGIFSPLLQIWLTGVVLSIGGIWFCMLMLLNEQDRMRIIYVMLGNIFMFWVIVFEVILFLWKILI